MQDPQHGRNQPAPVARPRQGNRHFTRPYSDVIHHPAPPRSRPRSQNIEPSNNVFINYIPPEYTESDLRELCSKYGEITNSKIMINLETGQSKCFGFVKFKELSQAKAAIEGINGMAIGTKRLLAKYAESHEKRERACNMLYVKRLPLSVNPPGVMSIFSRFGEILQVSPHAMDSVDPMYWRCFVLFATTEAATAAMNEMNNKIIVHGSRPIHVRYADETRLSGSFMISPFSSTGDISYENERKLLPSFLFN